MKNEKFEVFTDEQIKETSKSIQEKLKEIKKMQDEEDEENVTPHDPSNFNFIQSKKARGTKRQNEFITPSGKYLYSKSLDFKG